MSFPVVVVLGLLQAQFGNLAPPQSSVRDALVRQSESLAESQAPNRAPNERAVYEEQQFVKKFNNLLTTMREFAEQYNQNKVDLKRIKALKKAWRDLQKTDGWRRLDEAAGQ